MKKIISILCVLVAFCSCSSTKETSTITKSETIVTPEKPTQPKRVNNFPVK